MNKLELGDSILVADGKYEQIYAFGHYDPRGVADYLEISIPGASLEISPSHMVFTSDHYAVPASSLQVGDSVQTAEGYAAKIHSVRTVRRTGLYAPFTPSGVVVVNHVLASCFVGLDGDENSWRGIMSYHALAHLFETPHRMWCRLVSQCNAETYNELGISVWVARPHKGARWMLRQSVWIQTPLVLILLAFLVPLRLVEVALVASPPLSVMVLGMLVAGVALARRGIKLLHGTKLD
jgi:hypothetical protein